MRFTPKTLKLDINGRSFFFDTEEEKATITPGFEGLSSEQYSAEIVLTDKIKTAFDDGRLFLSTSQQKEISSLPLYMSMRNVHNRFLKDGTALYVDIIQYNQDSVLPDHVLNRSLGHANDENELEVFQVLSGEIVSIFLNPNDMKNRYVGLFKQLSCFAVPPGWFHCTYIIDGPAVVANFYCNAFWGADITKKPYAHGHNPVSMEMIDGTITMLEKNDINIETVGKYIDGEYSILSEEWNPYERLFKEYPYFHTLTQEKDIFSLFSSDKIEKWLEV